MTPGIIISLYLALLVGVAVFSSRLLRQTRGDYFLASRGIGPFMLLMSLAGTTMTAFSLTGSSGYTFVKGIGTYGLMGSSSALVHPLIFFLVGAKVWALGKKYGYLTQLSYLRDRYESPFLAMLLFPLLVGFIMLYIVMGAIGAGATLEAIVGLRYEFGVALVCIVVLVYVFFGGMRGTAWANTLQTLVFMVMGLVAFVVIVMKLGGPAAATQSVVENSDAVISSRAARTGMGKGEFLTFLLIPVSVGMFPHLFQHWLTASHAKNFKLTVTAFPFCLAITWIPCVLIGMWATAELPLDTNRNAVLAIMVSKHAGDLLSGLIGAGILAAMMSSMDSQFLCLGSLFTNDFYLRLFAKKEVSERAIVWTGRVFVTLIVAVTYGIALLKPGGVFNIGVWCFTGFTGLFPILFAALYWRHANKYGAIAATLTVSLLWFYFLPTALQGGFLILDLHPVTFIFAGSTLALVVVSLLTPRPSQAVIKKFFPMKGSA